MVVADEFDQWYPHITYTNHSVHGHGAKYLRGVGDGSKRHLPRENHFSNF